jgi:GAF domain-containing protein
MTRAPLTLADLIAVAEQTATDPSPDAVFRAVEALTQRVIGVRLFTVMRLHADSAEVERVYSSNPSAYPVTGRKPKGGTEWGAKVLDRGETFLAATADDVRRVFADHELIFSLGIGAILNTPIRFRGQSLGTLNLCAEANYFREEDFATGRVLTGLLVPALIAE